MNINFTLCFDISETVFIANANRSNLSRHDADNFCGNNYCNLSRITPDDVENYVKKHVPAEMQVKTAEALMNHLLMCHNVTVEEADRRFS